MPEKMITVTVMGEKQTVQMATSLADIIKMFSPYEDEAVVCVVNKNIYKSIDLTGDETVNDNDIIEIFPLIIGG